MGDRGHIVKAGKLKTPSLLPIYLYTSIVFVKSLLLSFRDLRDSASHVPEGNLVLVLTSYTFTADCKELVAFCTVGRYHTAVSVMCVTFL